MDEKKCREAIAKEKETIKTLEYAVVSGKTESLRRWAKDTIENSTIIIEALEKQLPKKVENRTEYIDLNGKLIFFKAFCPSCGRVVESYRNLSCHVCTQRLDWSEDRKVKE